MRRGRGGYLDNIDGFISKNPLFLKEMVYLLGKMCSLWPRNSPARLAGNSLE